MEMFTIESFSLLMIAPYSAPENVDEVSLSSNDLGVLFSSSGVNLKSEYKKNEISYSCFDV
jgi:hypothetical protein